MSWHWVRRHGDTVAAALLAAVMLVELAAYGPLRPAMVPAALLTTAPLAVRRNQPIACFVLVVTGIGLLRALAPGFEDHSASFIVAFLWNLYSLGRHTRGRSMWAGMVLVALAITHFLVTSTPSGLPGPGDVLFTLAYVGAPWGVGVTLRLRQDRERMLRAEQARVVAQQRATLARELHDVVAHAISVTVLQARGGRAMLGRDEAAVRSALDAIERTNTSALSDMRRLLAVLRDTEDETPDGRAAPQPTLANLATLVDQVRSTGLDVSLDVDGEPGDVPPGVDLSAYRIVQEALTNVLKHAGPRAHTTVHVAYRAHDLEVRVTNDGSGRPPRTQRHEPGSGHGLTGIRERVSVIGGSLDAGPLPSGGFGVHVRLPYSLELT